MRRRALVGALLAAALAPAAALAHGFHVEARWDGERVQVEAYFSDGTTPEGAEVWAQRAGEVVARGTTDAAGTWSFAPPGPGRYQVEVREPGLHRAGTEVEVPPRPVAEAGPGEPTADATRSGTSAQVPSSAGGVAAGDPPPEGPARRGDLPWARLGMGLGAIAALGALLAGLQRARGAA